MEIIQEILVFMSVLGAGAFLVKKYFFKKKTTTEKSCGQGSCGCH